MAHQLVGRIDAIDRIAHRHEDLAVGDVELDALESFGLEEVRGTNLDDWAFAGRVAKMARVPIDPLVIEMAEDLRPLDAAWQIDVSVEHLMQPCAAGARGTGTDVLGESERAFSCHGN